MMRYVIFTIANLLFTALAYVVAPALPLFANDQGWLPNWLAWFQTFDASLDSGWQDNYAGYSASDPKYWSRLKWLWRNPAYGFCYWVLGVAFDPAQWVVERYVQTDQLTDFRAHTVDGRFWNICYSGPEGNYKLGWKTWNYFQGLDAAGKPIWRATSWGPEWIAPVCFTPNVLPWLRKAFFRPA